MRIRIAIGDQSIRATLDDSVTARDFAALLPLTLTLEDYGSTEKISMLPRKLTTEGAPDSTTPEAADFSYYAPWGNLAFFLKPFRNSPGLVRLGRIDGGLELLNVPGRIAVRIEAHPASAETPGAVAPPR